MYPAAGYIQYARQKGASVLVTNKDASNAEARLQKAIKIFEGVASKSFPGVLELERGPWDSLPSRETPQSILSTKHGGLSSHIWPGQQRVILQIRPEVQVEIVLKPLLVI